MSVTVELSDELLGRLRAEAARRGVSVDSVIADFAARLSSADGTPAHRLSFIGIGSSGRTDPMEIRASARSSPRNATPKGSERTLVLLVDTNVIVAATDASAAEHVRCAQLLDQHGDLTLTAPVTVESAWMIETRLGPRAGATFVAALAAGEMTVVDVTAADWRRCAELLERYHDLGLGIVDASVIAVAERLGVSDDHRHDDRFDTRSRGTFNEDAWNPTLTRDGQWVVFAAPSHPGRLLLGARANEAVLHEWRFRLSPPAPFLDATDIVPAIADPVPLT